MHFTLYFNKFIRDFEGLFTVRIISYIQYQFHSNKRMKHKKIEHCWGCLGMPHQIVFFSSLQYHRLLLRRVSMISAHALAFGKWESVCREEVYNCHKLEHPSWCVLGLFFRYSIAQVC